MGCLFFGVSLPDIGTTSVDDVVGAGLSRGREETGVRRPSRTLVAGGVSTISMGTRRVRGFGRDTTGRAGWERFECSSASASTF